MGEHKKGTCARVRARIEAGGERLWRYDDFDDLPFVAVAHALSRLAKEGAVQRLSKGTYFRSRNTAFGQSHPNPAAMQRLAAGTRSVVPSGVAAANLLGFTTQTGSRPEVATNASSLPRKLMGADVIIRTRRPAAWSQLTELDAALLDFFRHSIRVAELMTEDVYHRTLHLLSEKRRFERLLAVADTEPPRVRALLGALGELLGKRSNGLNHLRRSLNPLSRFEFGVYAMLLNAKSWQAKVPRPLNSASIPTLIRPFSLRPSTSKRAD